MVGWDWYTEAITAGDFSTTAETLQKLKGQLPDDLTSRFMQKMEQEVLGRGVEAFSDQELSNITLCVRSFLRCSFAPSLEL